MITTVWALQVKRAKRWQQRRSAWEISSRDEWLGQSPMHVAPVYLVGRIGTY